MTKKDYERIALAFQDSMPDFATEPEKTRQWQDCISEVAKQLHYDNSAFVEGRFRAACISGANVKARHGY